MLLFLFNTLTHCIVFVVVQQFNTFHCILRCALTASHSKHTYNNKNNNNKTITFLTFHQPLPRPTLPSVRPHPLPPDTFEVVCLTRFTQSTLALAAIFPLLLLVLLICCCLVVVFLLLLIYACSFLLLL